MAYWPLAVSALCGLLLFAIVIALIFKPDFRTDLVAGQGKASLFGVLSVEGVIIVILCGMFLTGLLYPVWQNDGRLAHADDTQQQIAKMTDQLATAEATIRDLKVDVQNSFTINDITQILERLAPEEEISEEIRQLSDSRKGPWSPFARSHDVLVSVPGGQKEGSAYGCPELYRKRLQIVSAYNPGGVTLQGQSTLNVYVGGLMFAATNCRDVVGYDLKLSCADGMRLLSDAVLGCDANSNPLWKVRERLFPASAALILENGEEP